MSREFGLDKILVLGIGMVLAKEKAAQRRL